VTRGSAPGAANRRDSGSTTRADTLLLALGVLCASTAGPLVAAATAPALAIAFWRNALGAVVLLPYVGARYRAELRGASRSTLLLALLAGVFLAAHFGTFLPSLRYTAVSSATALMCSQTVWAALFARLLGERLPGRAWFGIALALASVLLLTGVDFTISTRALIGDGLALLGGLFGGAYVVAGGLVRRDLSTACYTAICYSTAAAVLLAACLASGQQLAGYRSEDWLYIGALTVLAQLLGHSLFNLVLRSTSATVVSLTGLFVVPLASVQAALLLRQTPPAATLPALALLLAGATIVVRARQRVAPEAPPVD